MKKITVNASVGVNLSSVQQHTAVSSNSSGPALDYTHGKLQMGMLSSDVNLTVFSLDFCNGLNLEGPGQSHVWSS